MKQTIKVFYLSLLCYSFFIACNKNDTTVINDPIVNPPIPDTAIVITSLNPTHGPANTITTIIGKNFDKITVLDSVLVNGKRMTVISRGPEQIVAQVPSLAGTGNIDLWYPGRIIHGPVFYYDSVLMVTTLAGSATIAASLDGQGLNARFNNPQGIALDPSGNIYVADSNAIRKITPQGNVTTLAGSLTGYGSYLDGTGAAARFSNTWGLAMGTDGFLYVGDHYNYRVRKVSLSGVVTTLAGITWNGGPLTGQVDGSAAVATFNSPAGVAMDIQNNVYVADINNNKIRKIATDGTVSSYAGGNYYNYGFQDGPAANALFFTPHAVAVDPSGNVFVSEWDNHRLRKITPGGMVSTLLGPLEPSITGFGSLFTANALATDKYGNLFFAIREGIIKMTPSGFITRYATGGVGETDGPAQIATYRSINGIAIDNATGDLYITDWHRVRKIAWQ